MSYGILCFLTNDVSCVCIVAWLLLEFNDAYLLMLHSDWLAIVQNHYYCCIPLFLKYISATSLHYCVHVMK